MKTWKLVSGILSIILFVIVGFQSCAAGVADALSESAEFGSGAGLSVAVLMLSGGIVSVSTRSSTKPGSDIALMILFSIASVTGFTMAGSFRDLRIWAA